jgi:hypothetical protein
MAKLTRTAASVSTALVDAGGGAAEVCAGGTIGAEPPLPLPPQPASVGKAARKAAKCLRSNTVAIPRRRKPERALGARGFGARARRFAVDPVEIGGSKLVMGLHRPGMASALRQLDLGFGAALIIIQFVARHFASFAPAKSRLKDVRKKRKSPASRSENRPNLDHQGAGFDRSSPT